MLARRLFWAMLISALVLSGFAAPALAQDPPTTAPPTVPPTTAPTVPPTTPPAPPTTNGPTAEPTTPPAEQPPTTDDLGSASREVIVTTPPNLTPGLSPGEIAEIQSLYDEAVANEADALAAYEASELRLVDVDSQVVRLEHRLDVVAGEIQLASAKVLVAEVVSERSEEDLAEVQEELDSEMGDLRAQAVEAYVAGGRTGNAELEIFGQGLMNELAKVNEYSEVLLSTQQRLIDHIQELEAEAEAVAARLKEAERDAIDARAEVAQHQEELRTAQQDLLALRAEVTELVATNRAALAAIQTEKANYEERLNYLQSDSDGVAQILKQVQGSQQPGDILPRFSPPTIGASPGLFGPRLHPIFNTVRMHNGVDFGAAMGEDIRAAAAGTVVHAQSRQGYGLVTVIDHGNQVATLYAHQSAFAVIEGQEVARGELIGFIGSTGYSTGPHLHFEVRLLGDPINPNSLLAYGEEWPTPCDVLRISDHPADLLVWQEREDCQAELLEEVRNLAESESDNASATGESADSRLEGS